MPTCSALFLVVLRTLILLDCSVPFSLSVSAGKSSAQPKISQAVINVGLAATDMSNKAHPLNLVKVSVV